MKRLILFFLPQFVVYVVFLFTWNPWLGFPGDWDLFSLFAYPLLGAALVMTHAWLNAEERARLSWIAGIPSFSLVFSWVVFYHHGSLPSPAECLAGLSGQTVELRWDEARDAVKAGDWKNAFAKTEEVMARDHSRNGQCLSLFDVATLQKMADENPDRDHITHMACDFEIISSSPAQRLFVMDVWGRIYLWEGGFLNDWEPQGIPGIPERHAVAMEIVPWRKAAVILRDDGAMYEVPAPNWIDPFPNQPRKTFSTQASDDRSPKPIGNFFSDYARIPVHPGRRAVDLAVDYTNQRLVALDSLGGLIADQPETIYPVERKSAFMSIDAELNWNGAMGFIGTYVGGFRAWPGEISPVPVYLSFNWPAVADYEPGRGGADFYALDVQGGVHAFSSEPKPFIDAATLKHYSPHGALEKSLPYFPEPVPYYADLEIVPGEKAFYRMTWNFRVTFSSE